MLAPSWGEPEACCYAVVKYSICRLYNINCICAMHIKQNLSCIIRASNLYLPIYLGASLAINLSHLLLKHSSPSIRVIFHMLQLSVNYHGNTSCNECTYRIVGFFRGTYIPRMTDFQIFRDFIFTNGSAKNSPMQWVVHFFEELNFTNEQNSQNLRTSKKTNYTVPMLYGVSVTYSSNCSCNEHSSRSIYSF